MMATIMKASIIIHNIIIDDERDDTHLDYQYKQRESRIRLEVLKHLRLLIEQGHVTVSMA